MCLLHTSPMTVSFVGIAWFLVVLLIIVCIFVAWEGGEHYLLNWLWRKSRELGGVISNFRNGRSQDQDSDDSGVRSVYMWWRSRWPCLREASRDSTTPTNNSVIGHV
jgi:hypothetical protein